MILLPSFCGHFNVLQLNNQPIFIWKLKVSSTGMMEEI